MLGLDVSAAPCQIRFAPHLPVDWTSLRIKNLQAGQAIYDLTYRKTAQEISLQVKHTGSGVCDVEFAPAVSRRAQALNAELGGKKIPAHIDANSIDQHVTVNIPAGQLSQTLTIAIRHDFGLGLDSTLPPLGSASEGLRITSQQWNATRDLLTLRTSGKPNHHYELPVWGAAEVGLVEGAGLIGDSNGKTVLRIEFPASAEAYVHKDVTIHFDKNVGARPHERQSHMGR